MGKQCDHERRPQHGEDDDGDKRNRTVVPAIAQPVDELVLQRDVVTRRQKDAAKETHDARDLQKQTAGDADDESGGQKDEDDDVHNRHAPYLYRLARRPPGR